MRSTSVQSGVEARPQNSNHGLWIKLFVWVPLSAPRAAIARRRCARTGASGIAGQRLHAHLARDRPRVAIRGGSADRQLPRFPAAQLSEEGANVPAARAGGMQDLAPVRRLHARQDRREPSAARMTVYVPPLSGQESSGGPALCMRRPGLRPAVRERHDPAPPT